MYALLFLVGFFGFVGMAAMSFIHSGHDSHTGNHGSTGEAIGSVRAIRHSAAPKTAAPRVASRGPLRMLRSQSKKPWWLFSPLDLFAYCMGAGAVGEIFNHTLTPPQLIAAAVAGALVFNFGLVKPILDLLLRFASRESEGLEGQIAQSAEAITRFDSTGRGLVKMTLDGQIVQLLATLETEERDRGVTIGKGDLLVVVGVDPARNTCRVTRELSS